MGLGNHFDRGLEFTVYSRKNHLIDKKDIKAYTPTYHFITQSRHYGRPNVLAILIHLSVRALKPALILLLTCAKCKIIHKNHILSQDIFQTTIFFCSTELYMVTVIVQFQFLVCALVVLHYHAYTMFIVYLVLFFFLKKICNC